MSETTPQEQLRIAYQVTFSTQAGQAVLADILAHGGAFDTTFDPNPSTAAWNEGKRALAMMVLGMVGNRADANWVNRQLDSAFVSRLAQQ